MHAILVATAILLAATCLWGQQMPEPPSVQRAALGLPSGARADWRQWDSFLTFVVKKLGQDLGPPQRNQVGECSWILVTNWLGLFRLPIPYHACFSTPGSVCHLY